MAAAEPVLYAVDPLLLEDISETPSTPIKVTHWSGSEMKQGVVRGGVFTLKDGTGADVKLSLWADEEGTELLRMIDLSFVAVDQSMQIDAPIWVPFVKELWISGKTSSQTPLDVQVRLFIQKACYVGPC
jgi:hypothetical protein